jgi:outer membrane protein assembly factor BamD
MAAKSLFLPLAAFLALFAAVNLSGCASRGAAERESTEAQIYNRAQAALRNNNFQVSIQYLEMLESQFPFGRYAEQAQLELVYAQYRANRPEIAEHVANRFIRLHPQHPNVDYAYYMRGMAAYGKNRGLIDRFGITKPAERDTTTALQAFNHFSQLVNLYPDSPYAADARQRMVYLRNLLAESEVHVANFYMDKGAYVAAANRARTVVQHYSQSEAVDQALAILIEAYWRLGLTEAAQSSLQLMHTNFPDHAGFREDGSFEFTQAVRNRDRSWMNIISLGLLDRPPVPPPIRIELEPVDLDLQAERSASQPRMPEPPAA